VSASSADFKPSFFKLNPVQYTPMTHSTPKPKAVCLFSGGLDSTTVLYAALREGYEVTALTVHYGQKHERELASARDILAPLSVKHHVISIELPWGGSSLLESSLEVPQGRDETRMSSEIPSTYVPARNTIFLSFAGSLAETLGAETIFIGANAIDYSGYPDCRPEFLNAMVRVLEQGTKAGVSGKSVRIEAPLLKLSKKTIVQLAQSLQVPLEKTWSCYLGGETPCGTCDSCLLRKKGFEEAGISDPALSYEVSSHR